MTSLGVHESEGDKSRRSSSSSVESVQKSEGSSKRSGKLPMSKATTAPDGKRLSNPIAPVRTESLQRPIPLGVPSPSAPPKVSRPREGPRLSDLVGLVRTESTQRPNAKRLSSRAGHKQLARIESKEELRSTSPTLSEAERGLEAHLTTFWPPVRSQREMETYSSLPEVCQPSADIPPPPPRKSSKRKARIASSSSSASKPETKSTAFMDAAEATQRARMQRQQQMAKIQEAPRAALRRVDSVRSVLSLVAEDDEFTKVDAQAAEVVVYHILSKLSSLDDLFNTAVSNKAFYRVFKANELVLMRKVLHTMSPAAWEHRETSLLNTEMAEPNSAAPAPTVTPSSYFLGYSGDADVIDGLKEMILERCQSLIRSETLFEIQSENDLESSRVDAALWRIWTFCRIFGSNKGREDDLIAQMDWLRGGLLAHQDSCTSTISTSDSFYISSVLLSAPEHFARGNNGGLTAEELYDMLEMWNCLSSITGDLVGQTEQARQFGVYDNTDIRGGDIDGEEAMLGKFSNIITRSHAAIDQYTEEWHSYVLTLGLSPILDIASHVAANTSAAFTLAHQNNWTDWTPPAMGGSRGPFLREAVSRLYEERICEVFSPQQVQMQEMRSIRRARGASFASELRERRKLSGNSVHSVHSERPMSGWEGVVDRLDASALKMSQQQDVFDGSSSPTVVARHPSIAMPKRKALPPPPPMRLAPAPPPMRPAPSPPTAEFSSPPPYVDHRANWQHPLQRALQSDDDPSANSAEKAIFRIVEMGFTHEEAKGALKITDMGDGLQLDRAIEFLLRQQEQAW
jgi:hypothetical protein